MYLININVFFAGTFEVILLAIFYSALPVFAKAIGYRKLPFFNLSFACWIFNLQSYLITSLSSRLIEIPNTKALH